jgi:nucleoside-diphosphate-sugar epimerase
MPPSTSFISYCLTVLSTLTIFGAFTTITHAEPDKTFYLNEDSVVLITGAAGFIGSELAMALHRTYQVKKLICIDSMDAGGFGALSTPTTEPDLALFEFKRQRVFHMLQSIDPDAMFFYRVDLRPSIPEYYESSEIPALHHIFEEHADITHVIHLADHIHRAAEDPMQMVIPRMKGQERAGMQEAILEELVYRRDSRNETDFQIQYVYASSAAVYNHYVENHETADFPNPPPFSEAKPLTTPSTAAGVQKLIDEMLAQSYFDAHGLPSIGLRLFDVYGPWGLPRSTIFEMAESAVSGEGHDPILTAEKNALDNVQDFIYIDDAVDAIMTALQLPVRQPITINVGTGQGTTPRTVAETIRHLIPAAVANAIVPANIPEQPVMAVSYADMTRSQKLLGFQQQVSLEQGLKRTLAWHYDRTFPYATDVVERVTADCDLYDTECLQGTPIFPCASECAHPQHCKRSLYDDVMALTRALTAKCSTVLYTVDLALNVTGLASAHVRVSTESVAYIEDADGSHCNIAFVSESSPLYRSHETVVADGMHMHGFWSLVPVAVTKYSVGSTRLLSLLPKLSPGKFFAPTVSKAIYCDPDIVVDSIPRLIEESNMQPKHDEVEGATVMLLGRRPLETSSTVHVSTERTPPHVRMQDTAYRMVRMAVIDAMMGDGFAQNIDAGFIVHTLNSPAEMDRSNMIADDGRVFRCDVLGEVMQWQVDTDVPALEFILGLHDMWSRIMVKKSGMDPWWIGEEVKSVLMPGQADRRRRLQEQVAPEQIDEEDDGSTDTANEDPKEVDEHNGFGVVVDAIEAVFGYGNKPQQERFDRPDEGEADDIIVDDDGAEKIPGVRSKQQSAVDDESGEEPRYFNTNFDRDPSSYDIWMGVLSSSSVRFFSRMVELEAVGVYRVTEGTDGRISTM